VAGEKCRLFLKQQKRGKMMYFFVWKLSPAGTRKTWLHYSLPAEKRKTRGRIPKTGAMA